MILKTTQICQ